MNAFRSERKWLAKNCLVAVAGSSTDGTAGLQEDDSFAAFRRSVENFTDIIFASTPKQRDFWLGRHPDFPPEKIEATYRSLKPCMHGCDAHKVEKVGRPDLDRFCWIKGDLSFETLRQAVIEPGDRVWIDPAPPLGPSDNETLDRIKINDAPWLAKPEMRLNPGLITIIGARGSGKTAIMEFLATGANALSPVPSDSSFLHRAGELLGNATVDLTWRDDRAANMPLRSSFEGSDYDAARAEVCYLSQQFVERLCSSAGLGTELKGEMERVVFEATPLGDRMQCESFDELANLSLIPSAEKREELQQSIIDIGDVIRNRGLLSAQPRQPGFENEKQQILPVVLIPQRDGPSLSFRIQIVCCLEGLSQCLNKKSSDLEGVTSQIGLYRESGRLDFLRVCSKGPRPAAPNGFECHHRRWYKIDSCRQTNFPVDVCRQQTLGAIPETDRLKPGHEFRK